jgi:hypothetical protein
MTSPQPCSALATNPTHRRASKTVWAGRILSGLFIVFMLLASVAPKLLFPEVGQAYAIMDQLGWPRKHLLLIAAIELVGTVLYAAPRTSVLGAVLMTALLGGAVASQLRADSPLWSHTLFGVYLGVIMWCGLWLRQPALRALMPFRSAAPE